MPTRGTNPAFNAYIQVLTRAGAGGAAQERQIIPFQFWPHNFKESKAAVYNDIAIIGRSVPVKNYSHSSSRTINVSLEFFAHPERGDTNNTPQAIKDKVNSLRALTYPDYSGFIVAPPPKCIIRLGYNVGMVGVCKSVGVSYSGQHGPYPWDLTDGQNLSLAHGATVDLVFEEVLNIPISYDEVKIGLNAVGSSEFSGDFNTRASIAGNG